MSGKKWFSLFILSSVFSLIGIEAIYRFHDYSRNEVDYVVNDKLPKLDGKVFNTIILGDSLAHHAFSELILRDNILDLTTNQAISMAGNYFILKEYLARNKTPKDVYLFAIPSLFYNDLHKWTTYLYFETVFTHKDQIEEIQKMRPLLFASKFTIDKFVEKRRDAFLIFNHYHPPHRMQVNIVNEKDLFEIEPFMNKVIKKNIDDMIKSKKLVLGIPKIYIDKISKLCRNKKITFTLVIEPQPKVVNDTFKQSKMYHYLLHRNIKIININDYYTFSNSFFRGDGFHINGKVNSFFQILIDKYILDIYP